MESVIDMTRKARKFKKDSSAATFHPPSRSTVAAPEFILSEICACFSRSTTKYIISVGIGDSHGEKSYANFHIGLFRQSPAVSCMISDWLQSYSLWEICSAFLVTSGKLYNNTALSREAWPGSGRRTSSF